jgi:serine/threonine protein phosphatase PrpC
MDTDAQMAKQKDIYAGTTAIVAYIRFEDRLLEEQRTRHRTLYTANVGDARAVLWFVFFFSFFFSKTKHF